MAGLRAIGYGFDYDEYHRFPWRSGKVWSLGGGARSFRAVVRGGALAVGRQTKKKTEEVTNESMRKWKKCSGRKWEGLRN
ncbi:hypothetical protein E5676_scaffold115G00330 [Cucumis melo var. makuwa]|uniref:Uncharacterized protein n=1 Tax=Cucumis melo var. makuwa TaxID=1194695 RepID=A0A5A7SPC8_CUCMM|nr:hypothetical protein E6C27_scaffold581G00380 [Cucumis melo var. makuwa]TYK22849.1 hypothetical protein E5676_scaffold115G00330 [Cucumis melo var. makuwa]